MQISQLGLLQIGFGIAVGIAVGLIFILVRREFLSKRKRAFDVAEKAKEEGFELFYELLESVATGDVVEMAKEMDVLEKMFMTPGMLIEHLNKLFTKQLVKRMADDVRRPEIIKAVDAWKEAQQTAKLKAVAEIEKEKLLAANTA